MYHEGTCGQVTTSALLTLNVGAIPAGACVVNGTILGAVSGSTVNIGAADATNPRRDIVYVDTAGAFGVTAGTAAAIPAPPALTAARLALAEVAVAAGATSISSGDIADMRQTLPFGRVRLVAKASNETVNNSSGMQNDNELFFSVFPSEKWMVRYVLRVNNSASATPDFQYQFALPASGTWGATHVAGTGTSLLGIAQSGGTALSVDSGAVTYYIIGEAVITISSTAGTANLQWAQAVATAADTIVTGSDLSYLAAQRLQ